MESQVLNEVLKFAYLNPTMKTYMRQTEWCKRYVLYLILYVLLQANMTIIVTLTTSVAKIYTVTRSP